MNTLSRPCSSYCLRPMPVSSAGVSSLFAANCTTSRASGARRTPSPRLKPFKTRLKTLRASWTHDEPPRARRAHRAVLAGAAERTRKA